MTHPAGTRRGFLAGTGSALGMLWAAANWPAIAAAHAHAIAAVSAPAASDPPALGFLDAVEASDVEAIASQIVPTDDLPGAREAGALYFIDRSLQTWAAATGDAFRSGLRDFQLRFAATQAGASFAAADPATQLAFLAAVENTEFFGTVRALTLAGLFALPLYGGNRDAIGWRLIGFDDQHAFAPPFGYYDRDYPGFKLPGDGA